MLSYLRRTFFKLIMLTGSDLLAKVKELVMLASLTLFALVDTFQQEKWGERLNFTAFMKHY